MKKTSVILFFTLTAVCSMGIILNELQDENSTNPPAVVQSPAPVKSLSLADPLISASPTTTTQSNNLQVQNDNVSKTQSQLQTSTPPTVSKYDMSWIGIYGKNTPEMLVKSWAAWRATQGTDNYAVKALGEVIKGYPEENRHIILSEVLYKIENEQDYYDFVKSNTELFEAAYAELEKGQEDLSEPSAMVLTALGRCRVKWHFKLAQS